MSAGRAREARPGEAHETPEQPSSGRDTDVTGDGDGKGFDKDVSLPRGGDSAGGSKPGRDGGATKDGAAKGPGKDGPGKDGAGKDGGRRPDERNQPGGGGASPAYAPGHGGDRLGHLWPALPGDAPEPPPVQDRAETRHREAERLPVLVGPISLIAQGEPGVSDRAGGGSPRRSRLGGGDRPELEPAAGGRRARSRDAEIPSAGRRKKSR